MTSSSLASSHSLHIVLKEKLYNNLVVTVKPYKCYGGSKLIVASYMHIYIHQFI